MGSRYASYVRKDQAMPTWLWLGLQDGRTDISFRYWLAIWYAQPLWADVDAIKRVYKQACERRAAGEAVHVDPIIPLRSELVCGLHVHYNLRIIPARENMQRSNNRWPGMPFEQGDLFEAYHASPDWELQHG